MKRTRRFGLKSFWTEQYEALETADGRGHRPKRPRTARSQIPDQGSVQTQNQTSDQTSNAAPAAGSGAGEAAAPGLAPGSSQVLSRSAIISVETSPLAGDNSFTKDQSPTTAGPSQKQGAPSGPVISPPDSAKSTWRKRDGIDHMINAIVIPQDVATDHIARQFPHRMSSDETKGLANIGNSCYRNALLQCLLHVPQFYNFLGNIHKDCWKKRDQCTTCALQRLGYTYWELPRDGSTAKELKSLALDLRTALRTDIEPNPDWSIGTVVDFPGVLIREEIHSKDQCSSFDFAIALVEILKHHGEEDVVFAAWQSQTFELYLRKFWDCRVCGQKNVPEWEGPAVPQIGLDVRILTPRRELTLLQYLHANIFNVGNPWLCPSAHCQAQRNAGRKVPYHTMRHIITSAPEILLIRLHRLNPGMEKLEDEIAYDEHLDLSKYTDGRSALEYRLDGVVYHAGDGIRGGHYTAAVRSREYEDAFHSISDATVDGDIHAVDFALSEYMDYDHWGTFVPYTLVYSRVDPEEEADEDVDEEVEADDGEAQG